MIDLEGLPGAENVEHGLADLRAGRSSWQALLVATAAGRLRGLGVPVPQGAEQIGEPELALYEALGGECDDPYYRYNAVRRELDSFISALEARHFRTA